MNTVSYDESIAEHEKIRDRIIKESGIIRFSERLKEAMEKAGLNNSQLAFRAGMSESSIRKYLKGDTYPGLDRLVLLAGACECSFNWLAIGEGETKIARTDASSYNASSLDAVTAEFLAVLSRVSSTEREALLNIIYARGFKILLNLSDDRDASLLLLPADEKERLWALHEAKKGASVTGEEQELTDPTRQRAGRA